MEIKQVVNVLEQALNLASKRDFEGFGIKDGAVLNAALEALKKYVEESSKAQSKEVEVKEGAPKKSPKLVKG